MKHPSVLITDIAEIITSRTGSVETIPTMITDRPPCRICEEWTWNFDMTGADLYNCRSHFRILALLT
jgi:hypothetical protein